MHTLKYAIVSLVLCLGSATVLSAKQIKITLVPENRSIKYQYALATDNESSDDESASLDPAKLKYKDVKQNGVTLTFDVSNPPHLYIKEKDRAKQPVGYPLKSARLGIESGQIDHLIIRAGSGKNPQPSIGFGQKSRQ